MQRIIACDFFVAVTATFRLLYVFVVIEHRSRRLIHCNVTAHPSAAWTLQQLREVVGYEDRYKFLIHDRDSIFASHLDESIRALGVRVLKSAPHSPKMNAVCERVIGTIRRECLDWVIPLSESHLRATPRSWSQHYNRGRPHMALGPGVPDPPIAPIARPITRHRRGEPYGVRADPILGGLHHEYTLAGLRDAFFAEDSPAREAWSLEELARRGLFARTRRATAALDDTETELLQLLDTQQHEAFMRLAFRSRKNILVSGPTGSGKTTYTKALIREIPAHERLITIEDAQELNLETPPTTFASSTAKTTKDSPASPPSNSSNPASA